MPRTVSASAAKTQFGSIVAWAIEHRDDVIVESHGKPRVVIIPFEEYQKMAAQREETRRRDALARLERLRDEVRARNQDLDEEEAISLADRFSREVIDDLIKEDKVRYQGRLG